MKIIICIGGDGTLNEVVNAIMVTYNLVARTIIPNGTGKRFLQRSKIFV